VRHTLTAVFVVNPMIVYYGANGMSEGLFLFTLVVAARYLARWLKSDGTGSLVIAATALGFGYLARNEAVFAAFFAALVVLLVGLARGSARPPRERIYKAMMDAFICSLPFAVSFIGWAVVSWVIVGHPFEQFSSVYGTSSQLKVIAQSGGIKPTTAQAFRHSIEASTALAPVLPIGMMAAFLMAVKRRDLRFLAPVATLGGVLLFAVVAFTLGQTAGWFRYFITAVPLQVMLAASVLAGALAGRRDERANAAGTAAESIIADGNPIAADAVTTDDPESTSRRRRLTIWLSKKTPGWLTSPPGWLKAIPRHLGRFGIATMVIVVAALSIPTAAWALLYSTVAGEEQQHLLYILRPDQHSQGQRDEKHRYEGTVKMARYLDSMKLPHGAILVDNFTPCVPYILMESRHPLQFVIPNDRDFERSVADPATFHIKYLMVPPTAGYGTLDALNRAWPKLYEDGAGIATPFKDISGPGCPTFRLFKVTGSSS
jgi:hypothetical protein